MKGVSLLVIGNATYMHYAANLMCSIKYYNPKIKINMITENHLVETIPKHFMLWDFLTIIDESDSYHNGKLSPGLAKVSLYKYLFDTTGWKETIYLDVDAIAIRDISGLFECSGYFHVQKDAKHWADDKEISEHFGVKKNIHGVNTSYQYIKKCDESEKLFDLWRDLYVNSSYPMEKQLNSWFKNQPDELYLTATLSKLGIKNPFPDFSESPIYFRSRFALGERKAVSEITEQHWLIGYYGDQRFNHKSLAKLYDKLAQKHAMELLKVHNIYKYHYLINNKHKY